MARSSDKDKLLFQIERDGFAIVAGVLDSARVDAVVHELDAALRPRQEATAIRSDAGNVYAARILLTLWPPVADVWRQPPLPEILAAVLGDRFGLVRVLYFDKPPDRTWALPWHKDLTIAVRDNRLPSEHFCHPTTKVGVPHVEAPTTVLERMLTARIHLDPMTDENGPLKLLPGSHRDGKTLRLDGAQPFTLHVGRGGVLLVRPLVSHCSAASHPETRFHRRVLHLEFAASPELPDGYAWHDYLR
jgi:ectoine hydroxylase-related dioxygenase (phytanoyl-CoA dioxygenase family)